MQHSKVKGQAANAQNSKTVVVYKQQQNTTAMPTVYKNKGEKNLWSDEQLHTAMEAVSSGELKDHAAAKQYGIPSSTVLPLGDTLQGSKMHVGQSLHSCSSWKSPLLNDWHVLSLFIDGYLTFPKLPHPPMFDTPTLFRSYFPNCAAVSAPLQDIASAVVLLCNFQVW